MHPLRTLAHQTPRFILALFFSAGMLFSFNACTVKPYTIEPGTIPKIDTLAPDDADYGRQLFEDLSDDYPLSTSAAGYERLVKILDHLIQAAEVDHLPWHIYLFDDPDTVEVRAVHGNYIFVWSGFLDVAENDDEIAALIAWEIAHILARHTYPVEFTLWSDLLFDVAETAASIAIMQVSQGAVVISGRGWMKWAYVEMADLDALDREYSFEEEKEAAMIAMLIMDRSEYSSLALLSFWQRIQQDEGLQAKVKQLHRNLAPHNRIKIVEALFNEPFQTIKPDPPVSPRVSQLHPNANLRHFQ